MSEATRTAAERRNHVLTGSVRKTIARLALPIFCEQVLFFLVGFCDTYFSGRISTEATTAIGLAAYVGWLASMLFGLVGIGTTALVSRSWGAGQFEEGNRIANQSLVLAGILGGLVYAFIYTAAPGLAVVMDMAPETRDIVVRYLRLDGLGHLFTSVSLIGAAALRGTGDMRSPMLILGTVSVLNVLVTAALVFGVGPVPALGLPRTLIAPMGIDGIVLGTIIARMIGGLLMIAALRRGLSGLRLGRGDLRLRGETVRRILRIGVPAATDGAIMWGGQLVFLTIIAHLSRGSMDSRIFAAHVVGINVESVTYLPAAAWGFASATVVGQSLGARNPDRAARAGQEGALQCGLFGLLITVFFLSGAEGIYHFMHDDPEVARIGVPAFRMLAFFQIPLIASIVYKHALRGAGDTRSPMLFTIIGVLGVRLPVAYVCGIVLQGGLFGAWIGMCADVLLRALLMAGRFLHGGWMKIRV